MPSPDFLSPQIHDHIAGAFDDLLIELLKKDTQRMRILEAVHNLNLPDCYIAAGFVRNLVWDYLHKSKTPLNDVDVIFFDSTDKTNGKEQLHSDCLAAELPQYKWEVKNQARMHIRNGDEPYKSTLDAMGYWPEKETAIGVALSSEGVIEIVSAFGLSSLFAGEITRNEKRDRSVFLQRVESKEWLSNWSELKLVL